MDIRNKQLRLLFGLVYGSLQDWYSIKMNKNFTIEEIHKRCKKFRIIESTKDMNEHQLGEYIKGMKWIIELTYPFCINYKPSEWDKLELQSLEETYGRHIC